MDTQQGEKPGPTPLHEALWLSEDRREQQLSNVVQLTQMARQAAPGSADARGCSSMAAIAREQVVFLGRIIGHLQRALTEQAHR